MLFSNSDLLCAVALRLAFCISLSQCLKQLPFVVHSLPVDHIILFIFMFAVGSFYIDSFLENLDDVIKAVELLCRVRGRSAQRLSLAECHESCGCHKRPHSAASRASPGSAPQLRCSTCHMACRLRHSSCDAALSVCRLCSCYASFQCDTFQ